MLRRRFLRMALRLGVMAMVLDLGVGLLLAYLFLHPTRVPVRRTPATYGLRFEAVSLRASDGTRLAAWHVPCAGARAAVVLCHGYPMNREDILDIIPALHRAGFHVLAFDFRALGESEGRICTFGKEEAGDVLAAVDELRSRPEVDPGRIGVLGWSMGAASCLLAASRSEAVRAVVADSAFARLDEMIEERLRVLPAPLRRPLAYSTRRWAERLGGFDAAAVSPVNAVGHVAPRPILFIHGERDGLIPVSHAVRLHAAAPSSVLWRVPGADHVHAHALHPEEYERRVIAFFRRHLIYDGTGGE